jgi:hypothetical protein
MAMEDLIRFGRSWAYAPELAATGRGFVNKGYDKAQRCYLLEKTGSKAEAVEFTLKGSKDSPVMNPAILVKNWNTNGAKILVNGKETKTCKVGLNHQLDGDVLVLFIPLKAESSVRVTILP